MNPLQPIRPYLLQLMNTIRITLNSEGEPGIDLDLSAILNIQDQTKATSREQYTMRLVKYLYYRNFANQAFPIKDFYPLSLSPVRANDKTNNHNAMGVLNSKRNGIIRIIGPSGSGKTALVRRYVWEARKNNETIFLLRLKTKSGSSPDTQISIMGWFEEFFREFVDESTFNTLREALENRSGTFVIDGLDHLRANQPWSREVVDHLHKFFVGWENCKVIVTARTERNFHNSFQGDDIYKIDALSIDDLNNFLQTVYPGKSKRTIENFCRTLVSPTLDRDRELRPIDAIILFERWRILEKQTNVTDSDVNGQVLPVQAWMFVLKHHLFEPEDRQVHPRFDGQEIHDIRKALLDAIIEKWPRSAQPMRITKPNLKVMLEKELQKKDFNEKLSDKFFEYLLPIGICIEPIWESEWRYAVVHDSVQELLYADRILNDITNGVVGMIEREYFSPEILSLVARSLTDNLINKLQTWAENPRDMGLMVCKVAISILGFVENPEKIGNVHEFLRRRFELEQDVGVSGRLAVALSRSGSVKYMLDFVRKLPAFDATRQNQDPMRPMSFEIDEFVDREMNAACFAETLGLLTEYLEREEPHVRKHALILLMKLDKLPDSCVVVRYCQRVVKELRKRSDPGNVFEERMRALIYGFEALARNASKADLEFVEFLKNMLVNIDREAEWVKHLEAIANLTMVRIRRKERRLVGNDNSTSHSGRRYKDITVYLVRHSESDGNVKNRYLGARLNGTLTEKGKMQADATGKAFCKLMPQKRFPPKPRLVASVLLRAVDTATAIKNALDLDQVFRHAGLNEADFGDWTGRTKEELIKDHEEEYKQWQENRFEFCPAGGETNFEVRSRCCSAFLELVESASQVGQDLIIVSHYTPLALILQHFAGVTAVKLDNCSITSLIWHDCDFVVGLQDNTEHLGEYGGMSQEYLQ